MIREKKHQKRHGKKNKTEQSQMHWGGKWGTHTIHPGNNVTSELKASASYYREKLVWKHLLGRLLFTTVRAESSAS